MEMPDITPAQKLALVQQVATIALAVVLMLLTEATLEALVLIVESLTTSAALIVGDAHIRNGRSRALLNPEALRELERPGQPVIRK